MYAYMHRLGLARFALLWNGLDFRPVFVLFFDVGRLPWDLDGFGFGFGFGFGLHTSPLGI